MKEDSPILLLITFIAISLIVKIIWFEYRPEKIRKDCYKSVEKMESLSRSFAFSECVHKQGIPQ